MQDMFAEKLMQMSSVLKLTWQNSFQGYSLD
jgi:hypothetical protein